MHKCGPPFTGCPRADQKRGCNRDGDLDESHLEALIDPDGAVIRRKDDQGHHNKEKDKRPNIFRRKNLKQKGLHFVIFMLPAPLIAAGILFKSLYRVPHTSQSPLSCTTW